jgi:hypothetical protein
VIPPHELKAMESGKSMFHPPITYTKDEITRDYMSPLEGLPKIQKKADIEERAVEALMGLCLSEDLAREAIVVLKEAGIVLFAIDKPVAPQRDELPLDVEK